MPDAFDPGVTVWGDPDADPNDIRALAETRGGQPYTELHLAHRAVDAALAGATLPADVSADVTARLSEITALVAHHQAPRERERYDGMRPDLPGRGHPLLPAYLIDYSRDGVVRGRVTFSRFHVGGNHAVHGGVQPLLFDDVLGHAANAHQQGIARTAYLKVNYRAVTPVDVELTFEAKLDRLDGRKRWCTGGLFGPDGTVLADADALYVQLLPGQP